MLTITNQIYRYLFQERALVWAVIGKIRPGSQFQRGRESLIFEDLAQQTPHRIWRSNTDLTQALASRSAGKTL